MHNANGEEILDQTPVSIPLTFRRPMPLNERIKQMVRQEASILAQSQGFETFEEADDFNIDDDEIDPTSPWEEHFDPEQPFIGAREAEIRHGQVKDLDESKIHAGQKELDTLHKRSLKHKQQSKRLAEPKQHVEDESTFDEQTPDESSENSRPT